MEAIKLSVNSEEAYCLKMATRRMFLTLEKREKETGQLSEKESKYYSQYKELFSRIVKAEREVLEA